MEQIVLLQNNESKTLLDIDGNIKVLTFIKRSTKRVFNDEINISVGNNIIIVYIRIQL